MSSRSSAKAAKIRAERERLLEAGQVYEALQLYKTAVSRARSRKEWAEAQELAADGAAALLSKGGADAANCGGELAAALLELYGKSGAPCGPEQVRTLLNLASLFPAVTAAPASSTSSSAAGADSSKDPLVTFLKAGLKWSQTVAPAAAAAGGAGCPDLHLSLARRLVLLGDYAGAHQQFLRSGGAAVAAAGDASKESLDQQRVQEHANLLLTWSGPDGGGLPGELDLFVARAVLQYACVEDLASANALLKHFATRDASLSASPLLHFASFLLEVCERSAAAAPLFDVLRVKYAPALSRDPGLDAYLDKIAAVFFGRAQPKSFLDSMMGQLDAQAKPAPKQSAVEAAAPPAAAAPAAAPDVSMASPDVD